MDQDPECSSADTEMDLQPLGLHKCDICQKEYSTSTSLNRHLRNIHKEETYSGVFTKIACALCDYKCDRYCTYCCHLEKKHDINVEYKYLIFHKESEFFSWKTREEKISKSSFTKKRNQKSSNGWETQYFYCHRSGYINTKKHRNRALKAQGSCKMNKTCPAKISVLKHSDLGNEAFLEVEYVKTHVGHSMDLSHIRLNPKDKFNIALKLKQGVSFNNLLESIRGTLDGSVERIHLITRKDIHNIASQYKIKIADQDATGIDHWLKEMQKNESDNPVLLYKPQDCHSVDYPSLHNNDFVLGIMTSAQMHMLQLYGGDILLDSTFDTNSCNFALTVVMVFDELKQTFPAAFLISTDLNESILTSFFTSIKNKAGLISAQTFLTDVDKHELFHNAWLKTMPPVEKQIYSSWHVEKIWKEKLWLVKNKEKQEEVFEVLETLLKETDKSTFRTLLSEAVESWINCSTTNLFGEYFLKTFCNTVSYWANCYLKHHAVNINMDLEGYDILLKLIFPDENIMHLETSIHILMKYIQEQEKKQLSAQHEEEVSEKLSLIKHHHEQSADMDFADVALSEDDGDIFYLVSSAAGTYEVRMTSSICNCTLVCLECSICIHKYSCTCANYCVNWNICQHIHFICMKHFRQKNVKCEVNDIVQNENNSHSYNENVKNIDKIHEKDEVNQELSNATSSKIMYSVERKKLKELIQRLLLKVDMCTSYDEINIIKQLIAPIEPKYRY